MDCSVDKVDLKQLGAEIESLCSEIGDLLARNGASGVSAAEPRTKPDAAYAAARERLIPCR